MTPTLTAIEAAALLRRELPATGPRAGADVGDPQTSALSLFQGPGLDIGLWECTPGGWAIVDRPDTETVVILSGRARLTDAGGAGVELGPGDALVLPKGWSGRWDVLETVRKYYVIVD
jgi:uncharacterized protein